MIDAQQIADAINQLGDDYEACLYLEDGRTAKIMNYHGALELRVRSAGAYVTESASVGLTSAIDTGECVIEGDWVRIHIDPTLVRMLEVRPIEYPDPGCGL